VWFSQNKLCGLPQTKLCGLPQHKLCGLPQNKLWSAQNDAYGIAHDKLCVNALDTFYDIAHHELYNMPYLNQYDNIYVK
jgi:hypothetical protein